VPHPTAEHAINELRCVDPQIAQPSTVEDAPLEPHVAEVRIGEREAGPPEHAIDEPRLRLMPDAELLKGCLGEVTP